MRILWRAAVCPAVLLTASFVCAQPPQPAADDRVRRLVAITKPGRELDTPCDQLDEAAGNALIAEGQRMRSTSLEASTTAMRLAERAGRCARSDTLLGAALNELGSVLNLRGENDAALAAARESQQIHERLNDTSSLAQAWNISGNVHWGRGEMRDALADYRRALDLWTAAADRSSQGRALNNIANVERASGDFDAALEDHTRALEIFDQLGDRLRTAVVTDNIGVTYFWRGEYGRALEYSRRALAIQREIGNQLGIGKGLDSIGNVYRALGAYRLALQSFEEALPVRIAVDDKPGVMETSHNIGLVHFAQGDYELAIDAYKRGVRLDRVQHDQAFSAEALRNIGAAAWRLGQHARAAADFRASLAIARREGFRAHEGELLHDLGEMALADGRQNEAVRLFENALELRRAIGDQAGITESLTSLASVRLAEGRFEIALDLARQAADNAVAHDEPELLWRPRTVLGQTYRRLHRGDAAGQAFDAAIGAVEQLATQTVGAENLRQQFFADKLSPYHEKIALLVEEHRFGEAFEAAERSKARVLTQLLAGQHDDAAVLTPDETRQRARLRDALAALNRQIETERTKAAGDERIGALEAERRRARDAVAAYEETLAARYAPIAKARATVAPLTLAEAGRLLPHPNGADRHSAGRAIVEYVVAERQVFALVLTSDVGGRIAVDGRAIAINRSELARRVDTFRNRLSARDLGIAEESRALYRLLLAPLENAIERRSDLVVVPDGVLWNLPFQALLTPRGYLIETAALSYAPSMTAMREIHKLPARSGERTLLAMGRGTFAPGSGLEPLPDAETQVRTIGQLYGPGRAAIFVGDAAAETQFKAVAARYSVLHLATHGVLDESSPLYSYLELAPGNGQDDGRLEAWELMRMTLSADLVVLAACETGRGRIAAGEGVIGTMWALFAAGARSMVVSQYRIESKSATSLLVGFHQRLAAGTGTKAADLRAATLDLLRTARYSHPYYWAGFILVGDSH